MKSYLLILLAVALLAVDFSLNKLYQAQAGTSLRAGLKFNMAVGAFTGLIFFVINSIQEHFSFPFTPYSLALAAVMAVLSLSYALVGFRMLKGGNMASYTLFLMTGGMVVPYIWGLFRLGESFSWLRTAGLLLIFAGIFCANRRKGITGRCYLLMGATVFLLNGFVSVVSKVHQIEAMNATVSSAAFVMLTGLTKALVCGAALLVVKDPKSAEKATASAKTVLPIFAASALAGGLSYLFQLVGAKDLPATVLYPLVTGGSVIFTAIAGWLCFRERPSKGLTVGILLCFAGTCLFL